jgi:hypothetical protein
VLPVLAASLGCGSGGDWLLDMKRDERVQVAVTSSPSGRPVEGSVTGKGGSSVEFRGTTPFTTELLARVDCESGCSLGGIVGAGDEAAGDGHVLSRGSR